jgi:hypothetical protein
MRRLVLLCLLAGGCIKAPSIVVLDRATTLEREAAGEFPKLELQLLRAGTKPQPAALTREQLEEAGYARPIVAEVDRSDAERIDELLKISCIGEASNGALVDTRERCTVKEVPRVGMLLEKANRDRMQLWEWLRTKRPTHTLNDVRRAWHEAHLRAVVCGGQVQRDDGGWESKKC